MHNKKTRTLSLVFALLASAIFGNWTGRRGRRPLRTNYVIERP